MITTPTDTRSTVEAIYAAFGSGDIPAILDRLADDVSWDADWADNWAQTRATLSHFRPRRGREAVGELFAVLGTYVFHEFTVHDVMSNDRRAVAMITIEFTAPDGTHIRDEELHLWTFDEAGLVSSIRHYVDTAKHSGSAPA
ncbi:nuclear transport factor 2 family protein [Smaragdicoccus niigatensis]|uniref:nuclear transport factor 2 family protein n=1 Tax=Smaragdicoccus niigatensis TaxID=359359 RepID=UPI0003763389|nr:nuclear transport factor 2 family protein [Smaragdicoccus niigatensis]